MMMMIIIVILSRPDAAVVVLRVRRLFLPLVPCSPLYHPGQRRVHATLRPRAGVAGASALSPQRLACDGGGAGRALRSLKTKQRQCYRPASLKYY